MTCSEMQNIIDESFVYGGIELAAEVTNHISACSSCQDYLQEMESLSGELSQVGQIELSSDEADRMVEALAKNIPTHQKVYRPRVASIVRSGLAAAAIIIISFLARPDQENAVASFTINQYWEELQLSRLNSDDLSLLLVNGDDSDYLPSLIDTSEARYLTNQIPVGQADDLLDEISSEELEWLAQNYAMEM